MTGHDEREDYDDEPWRGRATAEQQVRTPATIIEVFGAIQLGLSVLGFLAGAVVIVWGTIDPAAVDAEDMTWYEAAGLLALAGLAILWNWVVVRGAGRMRACRSYRLAVAAAILSFVGCPLYYCFLISAPVAIWALVVLARRDVRAHFQAVASGARNQSQADHRGLSDP
jgi:hypothetical protein